MGTYERTHERTEAASPLNKVEALEEEKETFKKEQIMFPQNLQLLWGGYGGCSAPLR